MKEAVAILCAGGPAPGINTVIGSVAKSFLNAGYEVLGLHEGYKTLFTDNPNVEKLDFIFADAIYNRGGSALKMSRYKPKDSEFKTDFFVKNNVKLLVTIGGDDTASTANRISKFLQSNKVEVANIHVPKVFLRLWLENCSGLSMLAETQAFLNPTLKALVDNTLCFSNSFTSQ